MSRTDKIRAKARAVQQWCALTLEPAIDHQGKPTCGGIQKAHIVPESFGSDAIGALEHAWGLSANEFDKKQHGLDNIIPLRADWHDCFDSSEFILLPKRDTLQKIVNEIQNWPRDPIRAGKAVPWVTKLHHYKFVPIGDYCKTTPIFRGQFQANEEYHKLAQYQGTFFRPPDFDGMPEIISTAHPYPMVWKAYIQFRLRYQGKDLDEVITSLEARDLYRTALGIVDHWKDYMKRAGLTVPMLSTEKRRDDGDGPDANHDGATDVSYEKGNLDFITMPSNRENGSGSDASHSTQDDAEISESDNQPSPCYSFSSDTKTSIIVDEEDLEEEEDWTHDSAVTDPCDVDFWLSAQWQAANDDIAQYDGEQFDTHKTPDSAPLYALEETARPPDGHWVNWQADFAKRMTREKFWEICRTFGYVDSDDEGLEA